MPKIQDIKFSTKAYDLDESIQEIYSIQCDTAGCNNYAEDDCGGSDSFFMEGWRASDGLAFCPSCVRKIKKEQKAQGSVATKSQSKNKKSSTKK